MMCKYRHIYLFTMNFLNIIKRGIQMIESLCNFLSKLIVKLLHHSIVLINLKESYLIPSVNVSELLANFISMGILASYRLYHQCSRQELPKRYTLTRM